MAKLTVNLNGDNVVIDTNRPKVAMALAALVQACAERQFPIGLNLEHSNGDTYVLARILQANGTHRAYLISEDTGIARNSRKVVMVKDADGGGDFGRGYVTELPAEHDRFYDNENPGQFIDI